MAVFLLKRLVGLAVVLLGMSLITFGITMLLPADPARVAAGPNATNAEVEQVRRQLGIDQPLYVQYGRYVQNLLTLNLGNSVRSRQPITEEIRKALPATVELTLISLLIYVAVAIPLGVLSATNRANWIDSSTRIAAVAGSAIAPFWLALLLQLLFYRVLAWFPAGGRIALDVAPPPTITGLYLVDSLLTGQFQTFSVAVQYLILPVTTLVLGRIGLVTRLTRAQMVLELSRDYVRTARAKGLSERIVVYRHALRNAMNPIVTTIGIQTAYLLSGTVLIEGIFRWPGLGLYALDAIVNLDFPAVMGVALTVSLFFVGINLAVDLGYAAFDPRIRLT